MGVFIQDCVCSRLFGSIIEAVPDREARRGAGGRRQKKTGQKGRGTGHSIGTVQALCPHKMGGRVVSMDAGRQGAALPLPRRCRTNFVHSAAQMLYIVQYDTDAVHATGVARCRRFTARTMPLHHRWSLFRKGALRTPRSHRLGWLADWPGDPLQHRVLHGAPAAQRRWCHQIQGLRGGSPSKQGSWALGGGGQGCGPSALAGLAGKLENACRGAHRQRPPLPQSKRHPSLGPRCACCAWARACC